MALGDGTTWDETTPTDGTNAVNIDDYNRDVRVGTRKRMAIEHEWPSTQTGTSQAGAHRFITLQAQTSSPVVTGTQIGGVFLNTNQQLCFVNSASNTTVIVSGTSLALKATATGPNVVMVTSGGGLIYALPIATTAQQFFTVATSGANPAFAVDTSGFGTWESKADNTAYLAETNGMVCASNLSAASAYGYTDASNPPTTVRNQCKDNGSGYAGSICMPVRKGDYWKVSGFGTIWWVPLS